MNCNTEHIYTHVGGNLPTIEVALKKQNPDNPDDPDDLLPIDLTGATVSFPIYKKTIGGGRELVSNNNATITDAINGIVQHTLLPSDVTVAMIASGYLDVDFGGGNHHIFPGSGAIKIIVSAL